MAVGLLLSAFAKGYSKEELYLQQKFKERLADLQATVGECLHPRLFRNAPWGEKLEGLLF